MAHDLPALAEKLCKFGSGLQRLAAAQPAENLMPLLRRPGATTVAETIYVHGMLDHLLVQLDDLTRACDVFVAAVQDVASTRPMHARRQKGPLLWSLERVPSLQAVANARAVPTIP